MRLGLFGATGQVGTVMRSILVERDFPADQVRFFASRRSAGQTIAWRDGEIEVENADEADFSGIDLALCSMGATASRALAPAIAKAGAIVIDNSSAWRMDPEVPLVVPEVNEAALSSIPKGIVANPNCTTMVCMAPLAAIKNVAGLRRIVASTYQAVSGSGAAGVAELAMQVSKGGDGVSALAFSGGALDLGTFSKFPGTIAYNVLPLAGNLVDLETDEEHKFRNESRKILGLAELGVSCTCVRVPVFTGHSISLNLELDDHLSAAEAVAILKAAPGVVVADIPNPLMAAGTDPSYVGRIREDPSVENGLSMFVVGDNLRKGAALNAIQIAESLMERMS